MNRCRPRTPIQKALDFVFFPVRAVTLFDKDRWGLSSLATERFDYVAGQVRGYCLDVGCGPYNRFIRDFLNHNGRGIDVYRYEGLTEEHLVEDMTRFPFEDGAYDSVTFIANLNHVPRSMRDAELSEAYRCLRPGGNIVVTMGNPLAEILVHKLVWFYDTLFGTHVDVDTERGMEEEEEYYLLDGEIRRRLQKAGFTNLRKKYFLTQWCFNHMIVADKEKEKQG